MVLRHVFTLNVKKNKKKKNKKKKKKKKQERDYSKERVIAIDPGRSNLVYATEKLEDGSFKSYYLKRGEYYSKCGMYKRKRKADKWLED